MPPEEVYGALKKDPFEPFRVVMTDGKAYEIRHPEGMLITKRAAVIAVSKNPKQLIGDHTITVALLHILRLEPLEWSIAS